MALSPKIRLAQSLVNEGMTGSKPYLLSGLKTACKDIALASDPLEWQEEVLRIELYSNQILVTQELFDYEYDSMNVLGARHSGKTQSVAWGLAAMCALKPGTQVIITAPIAPQAARIIRYIKAAMEASDPKRGKSLVDWDACSAHRFAFKNKSMLIAVSGQENANIEGDHGNILVVDEAHRVPFYSISNKILPMILPRGGFSKIIKIGVSEGKGHFFKSVHAQGARNCICPWDQADIFLAEEKKPIFYKGLPVSRTLLGRMPLEYKMKYFPDRPDMQVITSNESSILDWKTQYELEWVDDIRNMLSDEEHTRLGSGSHDILMHGIAGERYVAGLDTAPGSTTGHMDTDWTCLAIWRIRQGRYEKVASFRWRNDVLNQKEEIWQICNPKNGAFRCDYMLADNSGYMAEVIPEFAKRGMAVIGIAFGASAKAAGSTKNWKNALADSFEIQLQSKKVWYPDISMLRRRLIDARDRDKTQIENLLEDFFEWGVLQRIRSKGNNDFIRAPEDTVEDSGDSGGLGLSKIAHDDSCFTADTSIRMLDGTTKTIGDLATISDLSDTWVYSLDANKKIVPGLVARAWKVGTKEVIRVTLDNGESFRCTPDHKIMLRDGSYLEAASLAPGQSVMPLYTDLNYKIASVERLDTEEDVYDITVAEYHNFALACGIFVSNCDSDMLAIFGASHPDMIKALIKKGGTAFNTYEFPMPLTGNASGYGFANRPDDSPFSAGSGMDDSGPRPGQGGGESYFDGFFKNFNGENDDK